MKPASIAPSPSSSADAAVLQKESAALNDENRQHKLEMALRLELAQVYYKTAELLKENTGLNKENRLLKLELISQRDGSMSSAEAAVSTSPDLDDSKATSLTEESDISVLPTGDSNNDGLFDTEVSISVLHCTFSHLGHLLTVVIDTSI